jgi:hypothetical protein
MAARMPVEIELKDLREMAAVLVKKQRMRHIEAARMVIRKHADNISRDAWTEALVAAVAAGASSLGSTEKSRAALEARSSRDFRPPRVDAHTTIVDLQPRENLVRSAVRTYLLRLANESRLDADGNQKRFGDHSPRDVRAAKNRDRKIHAQSGKRSAVHEWTEKQLAEHGTESIGSLPEEVQVTWAERWMDIPPEARAF